MLRVFIDWSVLFSAFYSSHGFARDLILMAVREEIRMVISSLVMEETRRNLAELAPEILPALEILFDSVEFELIDPAKSDVEEAVKIVAFKDAPILAAVRLAKPDMFVTLDKKHLLDKPELVAFAKTPILRPMVAHQRIFEMGQL